MRTENEEIPNIHVLVLLGNIGCNGDLCDWKGFGNMVKNESNIKKATYLEWQASLFGACFIAFALGVMAFSIFKEYSAYILLIGVLLHAWGMFKIHKRNNS